MALSCPINLSPWNLHQEAAAPEVFDGSELDGLLQEAESIRIIIPSEWDISLCVEMKMMLCLLGAAVKDVNFQKQVQHL